MGFGGTQQGDTSAGRQALCKPLPIARGLQQVLDVVQQRRSGMHLQDGRLQLCQGGAINVGGQGIGQLAVAMVLQQLQFGLAVGVA